MKHDSTRRLILIIICMIMALAVVFLLMDAPSIELDAKQARDMILKNHVKDTGANNAVSAIYLNYRLWDTLFEALVLLVSAVAVISFSRSNGDER